MQLTSIVARAFHFVQSARVTALGACLSCMLGANASAAIIVSEVAPWSSGNSSLAADWFELTNTGAMDVDITGWRIDDGSNSFAASAALNGVSTIGAGESVVFAESESSIAAQFTTLWFGGSPPAGLQIGNYSGPGLGLSSSGDGVTIFDGSGATQARISFGASPAGPAFPTFDNAAGVNNGLVSQLSFVGVNGAFVAAGNANEVGSPGTIINVPEPTGALFTLWAAGTFLVSHCRRASRSAS